jgi:hypothetical protein
MVNDANCIGSMDWGADFINAADDGVEQTRDYFMGIEDRKKDPCLCV